MIASNISGMEDADHIRVKTSDTGCGLNEEVVSRVFEPFFTTRDVGEGTGLGMSVSYGVIEKHDGYIGIDSEIDNGSPLVITLPLRQDA